ncbi:NADH-quinone oxidoreductase subunit A [Enterobacteriaceae endosymbiont of Neohaemonia nigricornis]|uniref:NADH-quinone oxidoreductase subunit A n=1 Tax=Enterobacteriaceae endosymbiont of Neohaemonia nigricornis TaxID=2675792 RepID=UPI001448AAA9|nr:NADH-quinone oxidoreductase subunit A [Enterobacteriaceae endosymbiont of Neohaemonia nigricornis]QJC30554.1 NADH-quinone oxidoreductase subunit A [Enterobacteriaceae endosymbiont of Neohaemonia nigricornis]
MKINNFVIFTSITIIISILILLLSWCLGGRSYGIDKNIPFESGAYAFSNTKLRIAINFFLVAIFFVIFDIETLYLYIWSVSIKKIKFEGFIVGILFILTILTSLFYLFKMHILNISSKIKNMKSNI